MVEEHSSEMSARDKRDARRIDAAFEFEEVGIGGRRGRRDRGDREREREPPPFSQATPSTANQSGPPRPAFSAGARRREHDVGRPNDSSGLPSHQTGGSCQAEGGQQGEKTYVAGSLHRHHRSC